MNDKGIGYRDVISNPTPVGIGIAVAKQLLKLDIMGEVEAQIANTRQIQLYEEDRHRDIASSEQKKREIEIQRLQSKNKVVFGDLQKRLSSSLSVRTNSKVEMSKVTYDNLKKYLDPPNIFKEADNAKVKVVRSNPKLKKTEKERKDNAKKIIENYSKSTKIGKWKKISKLEFITDLNKIIENPTIIDQASSNLCGIALPLKLLAENDPEKFANMVIAIFENGSYYGIDANSELMDKKPTNNLNPVEYVVLSSIKNELNYVKYDPESDWGFSGMTTPWEFNKVMEDWFGFKRTTDNYNKDSLVDWIKSAIDDGSSVGLLINSVGFLKGVKQKIKKGSKVNVPNHYIEITKIERRPNNMVYLEIWHWGYDINNLVEKKECQLLIPISQLETMTHFYGSWK